MRAYHDKTFTKGDRVHVLSKQRKPLYTGRVRRIQQNGDVVIGDFEGEGLSNNQPELVMSPSDLVSYYT